MARGPTRTADRRDGHPLLVQLQYHDQLRQPGVLVPNVPRVTLSKPCVFKGLRWGIWDCPAIGGITPLLQ